MTAGASTDLRAIRIFVASSEELGEHRDDFDLGVRELGDTWLQAGWQLLPVRWETRSNAMSDTRLQDEYNRAIDECDVFVMLYRTKVGRYTAEEFERAWSRRRQSGAPEMFVFHHEDLERIGAASEADHLSRFAFERRLRDELGHFKTAYRTGRELRALVSDELRKLQAAGRLASRARPQPSGPAAASAPDPRALAAYLQRRAEHWRSTAAGQLDRRFVTLTLLMRQAPDHDGEPYLREGRYPLLDEVFAARPDIGAWVLVGGPGSGKSTVLQHHELRTAEAALQALQAPQPPAGGAAALPEVCIWHRLSEYGADGPPPQDWLHLPARWPRDLPPPEELRRIARVRFLLDGLNEIQAPDRAAQLAAIDRWTAWAAAEAERQARHGDALPPVFSVRTLDQSPMSRGSFAVRQLVLEPWGAPQVRAFCEHRLGPDNALWPAIEADPKLLELSSLPFNLAAQCELFRALGRPAHDRAELLGGTFWQLLARRLGDAALQPLALLGDEHRRQLANGQWRQLLRTLPDRHGCLVPWLDEVMQQLHRRGRQVSVRRDELLAPLQGRDGAASPEQWLYAVRCLQLIDEGGHDPYTGEPLLRCVHQLWQEFFAARGIRHLATGEPQGLPELQAPPLPALETLKLAAQEALPGPDPTHWEEPVKLAVQMVPDPLPWIRVLAPRNLALAGRAAVAARVRLEALHGAHALDGLRAALLARSRDPATDLRLRIEAGQVLGDLGDPRYETRQGPHGRYLWPRHWARVPGGRYRLGDDASERSDERPETEVDLEAFEMAFAPVTHAEFRCFVDAGGYEDARWWVGETAQRWWREGIRNDAEIDEWRATLAQLRADVDGWIARRPHLTEADRARHRDLATRSEADHKALLDQWFEARAAREPQDWRNPAFHQAAQPVVGVCQFEARAYACWLQAQSGLAVRLPTEAQWEAAARGPQRHPWPWGDGAADAGRCNADPAHLRRSSPVGVFPRSDRENGLVDLAGNVWEWTTSVHTPALDGAAMTTDRLEGLDRRVVRGGSWSYEPAFARTTRRPHLAPGLRYLDLGFRLVVTDCAPDPAG